MSSEEQKVGAHGDWKAGEGGQKGFSLVHIVQVLPPLLFQAETPIEEFAPTPAFPALQYLESVDQGGVAWRAGLRTGDFLIEVGGAIVSEESPAETQEMLIQLLVPPSLRVSR